MPEDPLRIIILTFFVYFLSYRVASICNSLFHTRFTRLRRISSFLTFSVKEFTSDTLRIKNGDEGWRSFFEGLRRAFDYCEISWAQHKCVVGVHRDGQLLKMLSPAGNTGTDFWLSWRDGILGWPGCDTFNSECTRQPPTPPTALSRAYFSHYLAKAWFPVEGGSITNPKGRQMSKKAKEDVVGQTTKMHLLVLPSSLR